MDTGDSVSQEIKDKIVRQIEYYFSDINLSRDKFMNEQMSKDDGWIPFSVLLTFKRLEALTRDAKTIVQCINDAKSDLVEVSENGDKIRRATDKPLPNRESYRDDVIKRTLHIKGFPLDSQFEDLYKYCASYGNLESVQMRKTRNDGIFKGCILVVFKNKEDADKVLEQTLKYGERELLKEKEEDHINRRKTYYQSRKKKFDKNESKNPPENGAADTEKLEPVKPMDGQENVPIDVNIKSEDSNVSKRPMDDGDSQVGSVSEPMSKKVKQEPNDL